MRKCASCGKSGVTGTWEFCPFCGGTWQDMPMNDGAKSIGEFATSLLKPQKGSVAELVVGLASRAIEYKLRHNILAQTIVPHAGQPSLAETAVTLASRALEGKLKNSDFAKVFDAHPAAAACVPSEPPPEWYLNAVTEGQPQMDATELALLQAREATRTQLNIQNAGHMMNTMRNITQTLKG
jgi:hypothetical protein